MEGGEKVKIKIDKEKCIGCALCESICPAVFVMKGDKAELKAKESSKPCVKEAAESCAVKAIELL